MRSSTASPRLSENVTQTLVAARGPLLFAVRLWASVCLALFVAFWLELDNPFWAGTSAVLVCQPQLGASLRKGWFRMIGTVIGAAMIVLLTACFPQDRIAFLALLALWCGACVFVATVLRNFASYAAALAGFTAAIIAADTLGATGGPGPDVFMLAVWRASETCVGIACAGIVLAGTDHGGAPRRLAASFADLATAIAGGFTRMLAPAGSQRLDTQPQRRELARRVIALDPAVDQMLGEWSHVRYDVPILQSAVHGLFRALDGWRGVAIHLGRSPHPVDRQAQAILRSIPAELRSASPKRWMADPLALRSACAQAVKTLVALPVGTPSLRLLADEAAKMLAGIVHLLDGLALLVDAPDRPPPGSRGFRLGVSDWLPALVNAARAFVTIGAVEVFWVATAWPSGTSAIIFAAIVVLLLSPQGDLAFGGAVAFTLGTVGGVVCAAIVKFAALPAVDSSFPAFCLVIGLFLIPTGFAMARSRNLAGIAAFTAVAANLMSLLAPTNPMTYDTQQFYNSALATIVGGVVAALAFSLFPQPSPALRTRRLLALTLCDLRGLATAPQPPSWEAWEGRMYARLAAVPDQAEPLQCARLVAALSVGTEIIHLRRMAPRLRVTTELDTALAAFARGDSASAIAGLGQLDRHLAAGSDPAPQTTIVLRARGRLLVVAEALAADAPYFDAGAVA